jgi:uncharacterized membrane protein/protein-disulfide isomerase
MTARARWLILAFAVTGLAFAGASAWVHYRLLTDPTYVSPCDVNATLNCTAAYLSRFGSIRGVPVALGGVIWFGLVLLVAGLSRPVPKGTPDPAGGYIFALATIGLASILYLGYASFFVLKTACLLCMGTYVSVIGIFVVSGLTTSMAMTRLPVRLWSDARGLSARPKTLLVTMLYVASAASLLAFFPREARVSTTPAPPPTQDARQAFEQAWAAQQRVDLGISSDGASVLVVKFNDWLCPGCKAMHLAYKPILDKYAKTPGAVKYVVKDWPWNRTCNFNTTVTFQGHEGSCDAAAAVRMARDRGKDNEMIDWLITNQERLIGMFQDPTKAPEAIRTQAMQMLGIKDYDKEFAAKIADIRRDVADGVALNVRVTPTYYVNGVRAMTSDDRSLPPEYFDIAIQYELNKASGK